MICLSEYTKVNHTENWFYSLRKYFFVQLNQVF